MVSRTNMEEKGLQQEKMTCLIGPLDNFQIGLIVNRICNSQSAYYTLDEVKSIIDKLHVDKSPRPDGFKGVLGNYLNESSKCHPIYLPRGYTVKHVNATFITLVTKVKDASKVTQLWSISCVYSTYKILSKLMKERLVEQFRNLLVIIRLPSFQPLKWWKVMGETVGVLMWQIKSTQQNLMMHVAGEHQKTHLRNLSFEVWIRLTSNDMCVHYLLVLFG